MKQNKVPVIYKDNFISKIKNFFKNLFYNTKQSGNENEIIERKTEEKEQRLDFIDELKIDSDSFDKIPYEKEKFLNKIVNDDNYLNALSIDRLKVIEKYYGELIKKNAMVINKLKQN